MRHNQSIPHTVKSLLRYISKTARSTISRKPKQKHTVPRTKKNATRRRPRRYPRRKIRGG